MAWSFHGSGLRFGFVLSTHWLLVLERQWLLTDTSPINHSKQTKNFDGSSSIFRLLVHRSQFYTGHEITESITNSRTQMQIPTTHSAAFFSRTLDGFCARSTQRSSDKGRKLTWVTLNAIQCCNSKRGWIFVIFLCMISPQILSQILPLYRVHPQLGNSLYLPRLDGWTTLHCLAWKYFPLGIASKSCVVCEFTSSLVGA